MKEEKKLPNAVALSDGEASQVSGGTMIKKDNKDDDCKYDLYSDSGTAVIGSYRTLEEAEKMAKEFGIPMDHVSCS